MSVQLPSGFVRSVGHALLGALGSFHGHAVPWRVGKTGKTRPCWHIICRNGFAKGEDMNRMIVFNLKLTALLIGALVSASVAYADSLELTLLSPVLGGAGSMIPVTGTITAPGSNSGSVFLNGDSLNLSGPFTVDDAPFLLNAPASMNPVRLTVPSYLM